MAGVAGGIGQYFDVDPTFVRIAFVALTFAGGLGAAIYFAGWLLIPETDGTTVLKTRRSDADPWVMFGLALLFLAVIFGSSLDDTGGILLPLLLLAGGVFMLNQPRDGSRAVAAEGASPTLATSVLPPPPQPATSEQPAAYWTPPAPGHPEPLTPPTPPRPPSVVTRVALSVAVLVVAGGVAVGASGWGDYQATTIAAAVLATFGVGLIVSAFIGRGRGLAFLAIVALLGTIGTASAETAFDAGTGKRTHRPATAAEVDASYEHGIGEIIVDLGNVVPEAGERIEVNVDLKIGSARVYVPRGVTLDLRGDTNIGDLELVGVFESGLGNELTQSRDGSADAGVLVIDISVGIGEGAVRYAN